VTHSREPVPITIRGTAYPSINAAARALRVTPRCVHKALEAGTLDNVGLTKWGRYLAHPASTLAISACPVTSDAGPPSSTSAAA